MKGSFLKRVMVFLCAIVLAFTGFTVCYADDATMAVSENGKCILKSDSMELCIEENGRVSLTDNQSGYVWISNLADISEDTISFGVNRQRVESQLLISYLGSGIVMETTSFAQCAQEDGSFVTVSASGDSIVCTYTFNSLGFIIPVEYRLDGRKLTVSVVQEDIKENKANRLVEFSVLPFFGAGKTDENGFIMIPDGSGAIINFNNGKVNDNRLELDVLYGNRAETSEMATAEVQPVLVPCFGINHTLENGNAAMIGFVTEGAFGGKIITNVAGRETGFNYAYFSFLHREYAIETMLDRTYAAKTKLVVSEKRVSVERYTIEYCFGEYTNSGLSQMSKAARNIIFKEDKENNLTEMPLYLDMIMGVRVKQNFLGIPYKTLKPLTTLQDAEDIITDIEESGIKNQEIRMQGLSDDGYLSGKIDSILKISGKLGKMSDLKKLSKDSVTVYPDVDLTDFNRSGNGYSVFAGAALDLLLDTIRKPQYLVAALSENKDIKADYLLHPSMVKKASDKLSGNLAKQGITALAPTSLGLGSYCDYSKKNKNDISETAKILYSSLETLGKENDIMLEAPVSNLWGLTDSVLRLPASSSNYNLCDGSVPFIQMLLSGRVAYSADYINFAGDSSQEILKCIQTGSAPAFKVISQKYKEVYDTDAKELYAAGYDNCKKLIKDGYNEITTALSKVYGLGITDYYVTDNGITVTVYENGIEVAVNNTYENLEFKGDSINAGEYVITETEAAG